MVQLMFFFSFRNANVCLISRDIFFLHVELMCQKCLEFLNVKLLIVGEGVGESKEQNSSLY